MQALSQEEKRSKLRDLARDGGHASVVEMFKACVTDSVSPAICTVPDCSYTTEMAPDQDRGYCEACGRNTVASAQSPTFGWRNKPPGHGGQDKQVRNKSERNEHPAESVLIFERVCGAQQCGL